MNHSCKKAVFKDADPLCFHLLTEMGLTQIPAAASFFKQSLSYF